MEKAERRVGEYVAAGWSEFTGVVDMLIEEGALYDVLLDEEAELCRVEARRDTPSRAREARRKETKKRRKARGETEHFLGR